MYNGNRIKELLVERGLSSKDLLEYLGVKENGSIARFTGTDIKASRLEQISDFFGVSVEYFFDKVGGDLNFAPDGAVATHGGTAHFNNCGSSKVRELTAKNKLLQNELELKDVALADKERIIQEKEERIKLLEKLLTVMEAKQ